MLCSFFLTTRNNDYPYYYEKDAHSKVEQVVTGERNFFHPLLMLNTADALIRVTGMERTSQNAVMAGRWSIASFSAIAVGALVILAFRLEGWAAGACVGTLLMFHPLYFDLAHFFKEDPALIVGLALSFLAMHVFWDRRTPASAAFLGAAGAVAVSGKYVGVAALIMGAILLVCARREEKQTGLWAAFLGAHVAVFCIINYQLVANLAQFAEGFRTEIKDLTREEKVNNVPHLAQTWKVLTQTISVSMALLILAQIVHHLRNHRKNPVRWLLILYPIVFVNILIWSPRLFTRHFLPVVTFLVVLAGLAIPLVVEWVLRTAKRPQTLGVPCTIVVLFFIYRFDLNTGFLEKYRSYENLTREILIGKINETLPPNAVIATDRRVYLLDRDGNPRSTQPVTPQVIQRRRLSDFESIEELRKLGVTHIAAHGIESRVLFKRKQTEESNEEAEEGNPRRSLRNPEFYRSLEENAKLLWEIRGKGSSYLAPSLRFYELLPGEIANETSNET